MARSHAVCESERRRTPCAGAAATAARRRAGERNAEGQKAAANPRVRRRRRHGIVLDGGCWRREVRRRDGVRGHGAGETSHARAKGEGGGRGRRGHEGERVTLANLHARCIRSARLRRRQRRRRGLHRRRRGLRLLARWASAVRVVATKTAVAAVCSCIMASTSEPAKGMELAVETAMSANSTTVASDESATTAVFAEESQERNPDIFFSLPLARSSPSVRLLLLLSSSVILLSVEAVLITC